MDDAVAYENDVACLGGNRLLVERDGEAALYDMDDFVLDVPVVGHVKARVRAVDVIECNREVEASALQDLVIAVVFYGKPPLLCMRNIILFICKILLFSVENQCIYKKYVKFSIIR